jgi:Fe-S cluster assembly protein SufD
MKVYSVKKDQQKEIIIDAPGEYMVELVGEGAEAVIGGVFETSGKNSAEVTVIIHHKAPHTQATTTLKGAARDASTIKFTGRIIIDPDCGDSHSFLTERILLLSDTARGEAIPDLEIHTDDVSCSHAASISSIPEEQLFYLMSRGISREVAEGLIVEGFLNTDL